MIRVPDVGAVILDRYEIRGIASEGPGYLTVHAFDREVEVDVSLLWFRLGLFADDRARRAFLDDAVGIRGITHPHLRRIFDAHADGERTFVAAQVGRAAATIRRLGGGRPADELDILRYATAIGQGLDAAHQVGAVHGYLVPSDVVEVASQIKLSAVGLFRAASADVARDLFWTRRKYIAPEVLGGQLPSPASDVYSMGVLLSEISSGVSTDNPAEAQDALAASHLRLADILARATRRDAADRTQTVKAVLAEVRRVLVDDRVPTAERQAVATPAGMDEMFEAFSDVFDALDSDDDDTRVDARRADSEADRKTAIRGRAAPRSLSAPLSLIDAGGDDDGERTITRVSDEDATKQFRPVEPAEDDDGDEDDSGLRPPPAFADPATIQGAAPPPARADAGAEEAERRHPEFVSLKSEDDSVTVKTPHLPASERPDLQPRLRPLSSLSKDPVAPSSLGNYAPPREPEGPEPRKRSVLAVILWLIAAALAVVLGGLIALVVVRGQADEASRAPVTAPDAAPVVAVVPDAAIDAPPPGPCAPGMVLVEHEGEERFCIDRYEAPGQGQIPETELGRAEAATRCEARGDRLCKSVEWKAACRGEERASYPYGNRYDPELCNVQEKGEIAPAGSYPGCVSAVGAFDMAGNVAEWTAEGFVHGGSASSTFKGRCSRRYRASRQEEGYGDVGYRCCADPLALDQPNR